MCFNGDVKQPLKQKGAFPVESMINEMAEKFKVSLQEFFVGEKRSLAEAGVAGWLFHWLRPSCHGDERRRRTHLPFFHLIFYWDSAAPAECPSFLRNPASRARAHCRIVRLLYTTNAGLSSTRRPFFSAYFPRPDESAPLSALQFPSEGAIMPLAAKFDGGRRNG